MSVCLLLRVMVVTLSSRLQLLHLDRPLLLSLQHRRRPMLLLTLPLREKRLRLSGSYRYIYFRAGPSSTCALQGLKTLVLHFFFSSCFPDVILCIISSVEPSLLSGILGPALPCFRTPFLFSVSLRVETTTNLEGGSGRSVDLPGFCSRILLRILDIVPKVFLSDLVKRCWGRNSAMWGQ